MEGDHPTPEDLCTALCDRVPSARERLWRELGAPVRRIVNWLILRHGLPYDRQILAARLLHSAETYLRTRLPSEFEGMGWKAFRATVLVQLAKMTLQLSPGRSRQDTTPEPLPACPAYRSQVLFMPWESVGGCPVGGDWFGGARAADRSLWVIIADVTGHGYGAYLLAANLPLVWRVCWERFAAGGSQPIGLLQTMHALLENCLPEGIYVEGVLARFGPDGEVTVASAGGSRMLLHNGRQRHVTLHALRGSWLGLSRPDPEDQRTWDLDTGDELLMGSDGLFDQVVGDHGAVEALQEVLTRSGEPRTLFDAVRRRLLEALRECPQRDDITMVAVRRCAELLEVPAAAGQGVESAR